MFRKLIKRSKHDIQVHEKDVFPLIRKTRHTSRIANNALNNQIIPFPNFDSVEYDKEFWTVKKTEKYGNSYQLYIQSLRVCAELILEYEETKNIQYMLKTQEIIEDWFKFSKGKIKPRMLWIDHPTANRVQVIVHFLYHANALELKYNKDVYYNILIEHANVLSDPKNYRNYNHGLMMDRSLLLLGNILNEKKLYTLGYYRAIDTFWHSFSSNGIHLENSPEYHTMVVRMYNEIESYLNKYDDSFGESIVGYLTLAQEYPKKLMKHNKELPSIGDSGRGKHKYTKQYFNIFDIEAGISLLQNKKLNLYLTYICGYSTETHKHKDDLSITFNYNYKDFFVDAGKFNYSQSKIRKYIISQEAHSSFMPQEYTYDIKKSNRFERKISLTDFLETEDYTLVKGKHSDFNNPDINLTRTIIMSNRLPFFLILDQAKTENVTDYIQRFNLHEDVEVQQRTNEEVDLINEEVRLTIKQLLPATSKIIEGSEEEPIAVNAVSFGKVKKTSQIVFENKTGDENVFISVVYDKSKISNINFSLGEKKIIVENENVKTFINLII